MRAEIIAIGDELTSGQRLDTNSQWLSVQLADLGVTTAFHTTIGDTLSDNVEAFRIAAKRVSIVISTGGLGPTADDLTREALAEAFHLPLELREEAMRHIEAMFAKRKRPMPERNRVQALFPRSSQWIPNPHGTAPGIDLLVPDTESSCRIFALPGVPAEMFQMWHETVMPRLIDGMNVGKQRWFYRTLKVFGIGESDVEAKLPDLIHRERIPRVGITVSRATISLRISCLAENEAAAREQSLATEDEIRNKLGDLVYGEGDDELDDIVHRQLERNRETLAVIEVGGDSMITSWLARHRGSSGPGDGYGMVAARWYASFPTPEISLDRGSPSSVAASLSQWTERRRQEFDTDWCLVVGPYATHAELANAEQKSMCRFWVGLARRHGPACAETFEMGGHPEVLLARIAKAGLDYFRRHSR